MAVDPTAGTSGVSQVMVRAAVPRPMAGSNKSSSPSSPGSAYSPTPRPTAERMHTQAANKKAACMMSARLFTTDTYSRSSGYSGATCDLVLVRSWPTLLTYLNSSDALLHFQAWNAAAREMTSSVEVSTSSAADTISMRLKPAARNIPSTAARLGPNQLVG